MTVVLSVIIFMVHGASLRAQHDVDVNAGAGVSISTLLGTMSPIPGIPSPGPLTFTPQGSSTLPLFQLGVDLPIVSLFRFGGRLGYTSYQFDLSANENLPIATEGGEIYPATIRHDLSKSYSAVILEPYIRAEPLPWLGAQIGIPLYIPASTDYVQTQQFVDPPGLPFADGSTTQVTGSGQIPGMAAIVPGISIQADGLFPMLPDRTLMLNPFVGIATQISSWNTGTAMRTLSFNVGVGVRYRYTAPPPPPEPIRDTTVYRDTIVILSQRISNEVVELMTTTNDESRSGDTINVTIRQRYQRLIPKPPAVLQASLRLSFESEVGGISKEARLIVTKVQRTRVVPLLPVVVFDDGETRIPDRYRRITTAEARGWTERESMMTPDVHWQYHVLNVVGDRLRKMASSKIELIAYDDGTEEGRRVASERLLSVQRYIMAAFGIAERRLVIDLRHGQASQQPWVFLGDETRTLLKPLVVTDTIIESRLPRVRLSPDVVSEAGLRSWIVQTYNHGSLIKTFEGRGATPATLIWDMGEDRNGQ
jgi:hypothetical protein